MTDGEDGAGATEAASIPDPGAAPPPPAEPDPTTAPAHDLVKERYGRELDAWLERWKAETARTSVEAALAAERDDTRRALDGARQDADNAAEVASLKSIEDAYIEVTKGSLDRALTRMNVVTASVAAVTTIYTALLGLVYAAKPGDGAAFQLVALMPALFLGLSLFLVTIYAAVFRKSVGVGPLLPSGIGGQINEIRLITFMRWCFAGVLARSWALNGGIVSLGLGIATLPMPFVTSDPWFQVTVFVAALCLVVLTILGSAGYFTTWEWLEKLRRKLSPPGPAASETQEAPQD